jgi:murein DD-endopeptidase MepM/ murein hydrolase activator NlpD
MLTNAAHSQSVVNLIKALGKIVEIPGDLSDTLSLVESLNREENGTNAEIARLQSALETAPTAKDFLAARKAFAEALTIGFASSQPAFKAATHDALNRRVFSGLDAHAEELQAALADRFNAVVAEHRLNETAQKLPDLGYLHLNPLDITPDQAEALSAWRAGAAELTGIYGAFRQLAQILGHPFGGGEELSGRLTTAYVLGDIHDHGDALTVANYLRLHSLGTDESARYRALAPFVYLPLSGVALHMSTISEADTLRRAVQGI